MILGLYNFSALVPESYIAKRVGYKSFLVLFRVLVFDCVSFQQRVPVLR